MNFLFDVHLVATSMSSFVVQLLCANRLLLHLFCVTLVKHLVEYIDEAQHVRVAESSNGPVQSSGPSP